MRPEEYLALQWSDVDLERGTTQIRRALVRLKKSWSFETLKTPCSRRTISLPPSLMKKLAAHKRKQAEERLRLGSAWHNHDLIFCGEQGMPHTIPNLTCRYFRPILEKAELPRIRLYDLRHTCATLLLAANEHPKVVSERLGHASVTLTLDTYSHVHATSRVRKVRGFTFQKGDGLTFRLANDALKPLPRGRSLARKPLVSCPQYVD